VGRYPYWGDSRHQKWTAPYTKAQIDALLALLRQLRRELPNLRYVAGHEDLDTRMEPASDDPNIMLRRRQDPGPLFPWQDVVPASGLERFNP
jgi:N-acetylmuramoyl-L-alanine amidase